MLARPPSGHDVDQVVAAHRELVLAPAQSGVADRHTDPRPRWDVRETTEPVRLGRVDTHENGPLRRSRRGDTFVGDGRHGSMTSGGSTVSHPERCMGWR